MQSPTTLHGVSFYKTPRRGQQKVLSAAIEDGRCRLNVQLPTGYGKTFTALGVYSILKAQQRVNRCLYIVANTAQLKQFVQDSAEDAKDAGIDGNPVPVDVMLRTRASIESHLESRSQIFVITIQALVAGGIGLTLVQELIASGQWLVVVDEYHHYGMEKAWGITAANLPSEFTLAMSATPERAANDSAFGDPDITVKYREASEEGAVKPLRCHSYLYRVDAIDPDGGIHTYTTDQLVREVGSDSPDAIEHHLVEKKMRWSPKYVSPLVSEPIHRMEAMRLEHGFKLQVLITAMCCSHAELVYEQVRAMHPHLSVEWIGTGENGRSPEKNKEVLDRFCPAKVRGVRRREDIEIDVLVHVGMAGEGLDAINISEIVHLHQANITNVNNQINGRGSRVLKDVICTINVDSSSPYSKYTGERIMDVMDDNDAAVEWDIPDEPPKDWDGEEEDPMPEEPEIEIFNMECIHISKGELDIAMAVLKRDELNQWFSEEERGIIEQDDPRCVAYAIQLAKEMRKAEAMEFEASSELQQWSDHIENALSKLTGMVLKRLTGKKNRFEKSMIGDVKKRINSRKRRAVGKKEKSIDCLRLHYQWLRNLEAEVLQSGVPSWLE